MWNDLSSRKAPLSPTSSTPIPTGSATDVGRSSKSMFLSLALWNVSYSRGAAAAPDVSMWLTCWFPSSLQCWEAKKWAWGTFLSWAFRSGRLFIHCCPADKPWVLQVQPRFRGAATRWGRKCKEPQLRPIASPSSSGQGRRGWSDDGAGWEAHRDNAVMDTVGSGGGISSVWNPQFKLLALCARCLATAPGSSLAPVVLCSGAFFPHISNWHTLRGLPSLPRVYVIWPYIFGLLYYSRKPNCLAALISSWNPWKLVASILMLHPKIFQHLSQECKDIYQITTLKLNIGIWTPWCQEV